MSLFRKQYKILLVEDDAITIKIHKNMLKEIGCIVHIAENGEQALSMIKNGYDLIFMDIGLPNSNGIEVTRQIRQLDQGKLIPIIGLTAYRIEEIEKECLFFGMNALINKPTTISILEKIIKTSIQNFI